MSFEEQVRRFRYAEALGEAMIDPESSHLWADLEGAARREEDLEKAQAIQDISWVLTQVPPDRYDKLKETRDAIERVLRGKFGPHILELCEEMNITLEGFVLPSAKAEATVGMGDPQKLRRRITAPRMDYPPPLFAAMFARYWVQKLVDSFPAEELPRQRLASRALVGWAADCTACGDRGLSEEELDRRLEETRRLARDNLLDPSAPTGGEEMPEDLRQRLAAFLGLEDGEGFEPPPSGEMAWKQALDTPLAGNRGKTVRDLLAVAGSEGKLGAPETVELFGDDLVCKDCGRWMEPPKHARQGWICPITDGHGDRKTWRRLTIQEG